MNVADSEVVAAILEDKGYTRTQEKNEADVILVNTCSVRENAEQRVRGRVQGFSEVKKKNPRVLVAIMGCMAERLGEALFEQEKNVNIVVGPDAYMDLPLLIEKAEKGEKAINIELSTTETYKDICPSRIDETAISGFVSIMRGCNNFCTYCIVPYVRGRERSRNPEELYSEVRQLVEDGVKEITLLGQNVNSYGKDLPKPLSFAELLRNICRIEGDFTLRFMTSHPKDATKELIDVMAENPKIAKAFHLPLQSGSNRILQRMNRHYTAESYLSLVSYMRKKMPDIALTSDIIVGFPGESEEDFEATLEVLEKAEYDNIYSFIYSPRKGTPAAEMPDQIPPEVSSARFARLLEKQMEISNRKNKDYTGCVLKVLVEGHSKTDESKLTGRSEKNRLVHFEGPDELVGQYAHVRITRTETFALFGILEK